MEKDNFMGIQDHRHSKLFFFCVRKERWPRATMCGAKIEVHLFAGPTAGPRVGPKKRDKCLETSLLNEIKSQEVKNTQADREFQTSFHNKTILYTTPTSIFIPL